MFCIIHWTGSEWSVFKEQTFIDTQSALFYFYHNQDKPEHWYILPTICVPSIKNDPPPEKSSND